MLSTPPEDDLRHALASILLPDGNDEEGVVEGMDGEYDGVDSVFLIALAPTHHE